MIQSTFLHLPGVGRRTERMLWRAGHRTWDDLHTALRSGLRSEELIRGRRRQLQLFAEADATGLDTRGLSWVDGVDQSRRALQEGDYSFFTQLLRPRDHWRILPDAARSALYLDIETTGLSRQLHYVTVIGALYQGRFHQWVWPEPVDELGELLRSAPLVVTFNGRRFDLPFLRAHLPGLPAPKAHVDMLDVTRAAGLRGGQKEVEQLLRLRRSKDVRGFDGAEAVAAWCGALYGDSPEFRRVLKYNRADVEMLPQIAARAIGLLVEMTDSLPESPPAKISLHTKQGHRPLSFTRLRTHWRDRKPQLQMLTPSLTARFGREPVVVGVDLRANPARPTGWAVCTGAATQTAILFSDEEILARTVAAKPDLVSIDAPLFLPRGRMSVSDDSPCREAGGIVRDAERILWSRGIRVYPALIRQMQGLTARGIKLTAELRALGIEVIESYPGAAQDVLNIPRKKLDESLLQRGLRQFGYRFSGQKSHDELDAITSALVGHFYLAQKYEPLGADDEGFMIVPTWETMTWGSNRTRVAAFLGLPGAGKSTISRALAQKFGWRRVALGDVLRNSARTDSKLNVLLSSGQLAPDTLVDDIVSEALSSETSPVLLLDGFPRYVAQSRLLDNMCPSWLGIHLDVSPSVATERISRRRICSHCGHIPAASDTAFRCSNCAQIAWERRADDGSSVIHDRVKAATELLVPLLQSLGNGGGHRVARVNSDAPVDQIAEKAAAFILQATSLKRLDDHGVSVE